MKQRQVRERRINNSAARRRWGGYRMAHADVTSGAAADEPAHLVNGVLQHEDVVPGE